VLLKSDNALLQKLCLQTDTGETIRVVAVTDKSDFSVCV